MSLQQWSAIAQIIAAVIGIPSLIFVGIQLGLASSIVDNSAGFASIWREGLTGTGHLSEDDRVRFFAFVASLLRFFESARIQWRRKQLYREHWRAIDQQAQYLAAQPGVSEYWRERQDWHCIEFQRWFNSLMRRPG
jgi:hypothetical protein